MTVQCVVRENAQSGEYQLILRNTSIYDLAVKIVNHKSDVHLERQDALVLSKKYTIINIISTPKRDKMSLKKDFDIYARAIYPFNRKNIRQWIDGESSIPDKEHQRVTSLRFGVADGEYSAKKIIIDLPGKANMIEPTGYAIKMKNSRQILRIFMEHDTRFANQIEDDRLAIAQKSCKSNSRSKLEKSGKSSSSKKRREKRQKTNESCFLLPFFQSVCQYQE